MTGTNCIAELRALREKYGYSAFDIAVKHLNRERLQVKDRPERVRLSPAKRNKLFLKFGGRCHICHELIDPRSSWDVDHIDPNLSGTDFNAERNLVPTHASCNRGKGALSVMAQAKRYGTTAVEILGDEI